MQRQLSAIASLFLRAKGSIECKVTSSKSIHVTLKNNIPVKNGYASGRPGYGYIYKEQFTALYSCQVCFCLSVFFDTHQLLY